MTVTKHISELGKATRFGHDWQGERCGAKTRRGTECQRPAHKHNRRCSLHGGRSTGALRLQTANRSSPRLIYGTVAIQKLNLKDSGALPRLGASAGRS